MKFCTKCGAQMNDQAVFCTSCGASVAAEQNPEVTYAAPNGNTGFAPNPGAAPNGYVPNGYVPNPNPYAAPAQPKKESGLATAAKILMIISTVVMGLYIIPLAWCLPMTLAYCKKLKNGEPISTGFKVCTLLFVNTISGILMLCDKEN